MQQLQFTVLIVLIGLSPKRFQSLGERCCYRRSRVSLLSTVRESIPRSLRDRSTATPRGISYNKINVTHDSSEYFRVPHSLSADRLIDVNTSDEAFKANYSPEIAKRRSTLALKSSFHIINMILMGLSKVFKNIESSPTSSQAQVTHRINLVEVLYELAHLCFYDVSEGQCKTLEIVEYQPGIFRDLRRMFKVTEDTLF